MWWKLTFNAEYSRLFFAAERVDGPDDILALVVHLNATHFELIVAAGVLGHVLQARVQRHVLEVPASQFTAENTSVFTESVV